MSVTAAWRIHNGPLWFSDLVESCTINTRLLQNNHIDVLLCASNWSVISVYSLFMCDILRSSGNIHTRVKHLKTIQLAVCCFSIPASLSSQQSTYTYKHSLTSLRPLQNLSKTLFMFPPFSMEMTLVWSSSLIQIRNVFSSLCLHTEKLYWVTQYWSMRIKVICPLHFPEEQWTDTVQ